MFDYGSLSLAGSYAHDWSDFLRELRVSWCDHWPHGTVKVSQTTTRERDSQRKYNQCRKKNLAFTLESMCTKINWAYDW